jgi:FAS-associated factor 2
LLPPGEYDGLSAAVTEKAAQQFVQHLKSLATTTTQHAAIDASFSTLGFEALRQEAFSSNSLIVVYLHSPLHQQAEYFLKFMMISQSMLEFLNQENVKTLGSSIHTSQGSFLASQLGVASYPVFAMLQPSTSSSGAAKLVFKAEGPSLLKMQPNQLMPLLNGTYQRFQMGVAEEVARRVEREYEAELRRQQDEEYQETLRVDQERERQRQEEREHEQRRIHEEQEKERQKREAEMNRLDKAKSLLRPEPSSGGTRIRFQLPSGKKLDRRFESDETVASLKAFLTLHFSEHDPEIKNIALSTNFPKKNYDQDGLTLTESGLAPQAVLMVQDLDA